MQAHAKRVAAENKRSKRFALGGGFGSSRSRAARPKMGNARGKVMKAFVADSDDDESEEVRPDRIRSDQSVERYVVVVVADQIRA